MSSWKLVLAARRRSAAPPRATNATRGACVSAASPAGCPANQAIHSRWSARENASSGFATQTRPPARATCSASIESAITGVPRASRTARSTRRGEPAVFSGPRAMPKATSTPHTISTSGTTRPRRRSRQGRPAAASGAASSTTQTAPREVRAARTTSPASATSSHGRGRARAMGHTATARHASVAISGPDENENGAHRPMPCRAASPPRTPA